MLLLHTMTTIALAVEEETSGFTMREIWEASGPIARGVIVILILMLLWSCYVGIERFIAFHRARKRSMLLAAEVVAHLQQGNVEAAHKLSKDERFKAAYLGSLLRAGLAELELRQDDIGIDNAKRAVEKAIGEELSKGRRGFTILATTGSTAPFVGLFGTVFGVINAFQGMAEAGAGLAAISAGIAEALITTGVGIGVAIIGVWIYNYYNQRLDKVGDELASSEADFLDWAHKLVLERQEASARAGK